MSGFQRIDRVRRQYNQLAANQTLEDYALRFTAKRARRWSAPRVANTALGAISFLALEAIGATITLNYGFVNAVAAILVVCGLMLVTGIPICVTAARDGVDIDLLTRGAGFGYIGSTVTSLIYASFTFIFFAIEASILASALQLCFGVPPAIGYVIAAVAVIPLVTHGITFISRFQLWTQPVWAVLQALPFLAILMVNPRVYADWTGFRGAAGEAGRGLSLPLFGAAAAVVFSLVGQIGEQVDFLRFLPRPSPGRRLGWWLSLLAAGPGWVVLGGLKMLAGSFLAAFAVSGGLSFHDAADPTYLYLAAFQAAIPVPRAALVVTGVFVILAQTKINVTNAYAGSIAWSNFFSRLTHSHPGRVVWVLFNVLIALLLMEIGVYRALEQTLGVYADVAVAWVGALVADLVINKPLGLSPAPVEFKRAHLYDVNPVGVGAMLAGAGSAVMASAGLFGPVLHALAPFLGFAVSFGVSPAIAAATGGRFYLARKPRQGWRLRPSITCCICENPFEHEDMAYCPAYAGPICSLCCSLDVRCNDLCKPQARLGAQAGHVARRLLPAFLRARIDEQVVHYLGALVPSVALVGLILLAVGAQSAAAAPSLPAALWKVFFALLIVIGVAAWLFVLSSQSRRAAQAEMGRQAKLLMAEIEAHKRTDAALQRAKEAAEAANEAKSRYVMGLSHELRTPLNAILGYAQLMGQNGLLDSQARAQARVMQRSARHLSGLIDGLLDIAKIEAGRLHLEREEVRLDEFLEQLAGMVRIDAEAKGLAFGMILPDVRPTAVYTDEKRLRQILINLLSNAIKFTPAGAVTFRFGYRGPIATFEVADTGPGIAPDDLERIFNPFERGSGAAGPVPGTGLGLTICKMLSGVMGGQITVRSTPGGGSVFRLKLLLSEVMNPRPVPPEPRRIAGYAGPRRTVMVVDDDPAHRDLMLDLLEPLGFIVMAAPDGAHGLTLAEHCRPDCFLLDVAMPGMDGWSLARTLRTKGHATSRIVMLSAHAIEVHRNEMAEPAHDAFLIKPVNLSRLLDVLQEQLRLEWVVDVGAPRLRPRAGGSLKEQHLSDLLALGELGLLKGIQLKLDEILEDEPGSDGVVERLRELVQRCDLPLYMAELQTLSADV